MIKIRTRISFFVMRWREKRLGFRDFRDLPTPDLFLQRRAMRHLREGLTKRGVDPTFGSELTMRRLAVWKASRAAIVTAELSLAELLTISNELDETPFEEGHLDTVAAKILEETMDRMRIGEPERTTPERIARVTALLLVETEAELLRRFVPQFAQTPLERHEFELEAIRLKRAGKLTDISYPLS